MQTQHNYRGNYIISKNYKITKIIQMKKYKKWNCLFIYCTAYTAHSTFTYTREYGIDIEHSQLSFLSLVQCYLQELLRYVTHRYEPRKSSRTGCCLFRREEKITVCWVPCTFLLIHSVLVRSVFKNKLPGIRQWNVFRKNPLR